MAKAKRGDRVIINNPKPMRGGEKAAARWRDKKGLVTKVYNTSVEVLLDGEAGPFVFFDIEYSVYDPHRYM